MTRPCPREAESPHAHLSQPLFTHLSLVSLLLLHRSREPRLVVSGQRDKASSSSTASHFSVRLGSLRISWDWATLNPHRVTGLVFAEAVLQPTRLYFASQTLAQRFLFSFLAFRPLAFLLMVQTTLLFRFILTSGTIRTLSREEKATFLRPYDELNVRRRVVFDGMGPHQLSRASVGIANEYAFVNDRSTHLLTQMPHPKLLLQAHPGFINHEEAITYAKRHLPHLTIRDVGRATHFLPEDQPVAVANALHDWLPTAFTATVL